MTDIWLPDWLRIRQVRTRFIGATGFSRSLFSGQVRTTDFGGSRVGASIDFTPQGGRNSAMERAAIFALTMSLSGSQNRIYLSDAASRLRGSFPTAELISNNTFENGTAGFSANSSYTQTAADRLLRSTRNAIGSVQTLAHLSTAVSCAQYAPHVARWMLMQGRGSYPTGLRVDIGAIADGNEYLTGSASTNYGLRTEVAVPSAANISTRVVDLSTSGQLAGDYVTITYVSLSRCALVDAAPNSLLRSDEHDNAAWTTSGGDSISANVSAAPDGATTADSFIENGVSQQHYHEQVVTVPSAAADFCAAADVRSVGRTWAILSLIENTGNTFAQLYVNTSTGAVGSVVTGANWANVRGYASPLGGGFFRFYVIARKTNAATMVRIRLTSTTSDGASSTVAGISGVAFNLWRFALAQSSVAMHLSQTVASATTGVAQSGRALRVKGLPVNTAGLLLPGDQFEVITSYGSELKFVTAPLNSDGAGCGYLQFSPQLRGTPADNAAVIIHRPMGRFIQISEPADVPTDPGLITTTSLDLEEA